jgi:hypothetical protein
MGRLLSAAREGKGAYERDETTASSSYGVIVASKAVASASQAGRALQRSSGHSIVDLGRR